MPYVISNGQISCSFTTLGGTFTSIQANGREYLWQGDPAVWSGQAPICFPICGGLRDDRAVTESGKQVELGRHGFARKQEFELVRQTVDGIAFRLVSTPALREQFPFKFAFEASYWLVGSKVEVRYAVTNTGEEAMPFFVGGHPAFRVPLDEGEAYSDYELRFAEDEAEDLCVAVPSTGLIDVENRVTNPMQGRALPISHELFSFAETIFDVLNSREVELAHKSSSHGVRLSFPDMPYLIVWSKPQADFVAVEPWGGLSTCSDEDDIFEHKRGCLVAQPGETVVRGFDIEPF